MLPKQFLTKIENAEDIRGLFLIPYHKIVTCSVTNGVFDKSILWGYYPYEIKKLNISVYGRLSFQCLIVNRLGTSAGPNDYSSIDILVPVKPEKISFSRYLEFFETETEAIEECHLRNLGKELLAGGESEDIITEANNYNQQIAPIYY